MAGLGYAVNLVSASGLGARLIGSKLVVVRSTYWELSTIAPNPLLCSLTDISPVCSIGAFCKTPYCHLRGDNYGYQNDNASPHRARVVLDFLQQGNVTKMEQPPRSPDWNPIEHLWDELGRGISSLDNPPQNLDELRQALLDEWAQIPVQRLQRLVASMPRRLAAMIAARGGNTRD